MTFHLSTELESSIEATVNMNSGRFASVDDAMAEAARMPLREPANGPPAKPATSAGDAAPDPILGFMRDDTELMDAIVADAYRRRREETWREFDL